jgi:hypothetical protein
MPRNNLSEECLLPNPGNIIQLSYKKNLRLSTFLLNIQHKHFISLLCVRSKLIIFYGTELYLASFFSSVAAILFDNSCAIQPKFQLEDSTAFSGSLDLSATESTEKGK